MPFGAVATPTLTVRIIPGVSHSLPPDPLGPNSSWVYLPAFATSPQLLEVMTNWAATHLLTSSRKDMQIPDAISENSGWPQRRIAGG